MMAYKEPRLALEEAQLRPKKSFGQNFLTDGRAALRIAEACVRENEIDRAIVMEIGAGTGALTKLLLGRARLVVAIEYDRELVPILRRSFADEIRLGRLKLIECDAVHHDWRAELGPIRPRVLAGNLPYQITGKLLELACGAAPHMERAVLMVQREVADRLIALPSTKAYGALTVFIQAAFEVSRVMNVGAASFFPSPEVGSAVIQLVPRPCPIAETSDFRALVSASFHQRRKTLRNSWASVAPRTVLEAAARAAGTTLDARGETLSADAFSRAAEVVTASRGAA